LAPSGPAPAARAWAGPRASGSRWPAAGWWTCSGWGRGSRAGLSEWCGLQDLARPGGIAVHLRDQGRQVGEFFLVAQPGDELDADAVPVQVAVEVEQVRLQQRLHPADGRAGTKAGNRGPRGVAHAVHAGGVDARQRRHLAAETQVGGRIAEGAAKLAAAHHAPGDGVRRAQQAGRGVEVALDQGGADAGAGNALAVQHHRLDLVGAETVLGALAAQGPKVAAAAVAEAE